MLSEIFSTLEIDEEAPEELAFCRPEEFRPQDHSDAWFLNDSSSESLSYRAFHAYHVGDYDAAYQFFNEMMARGGHNRVHTVSIYESIIRSALKSSRCPDDELERILERYKGVATEYGDQLQYWSTAVEVFRKIPGRERDYLRTVILLCLTVDSPEHWLLFGRHPDLKAGPNFEIGFLTRALALLENNAEFAFGFVAELMKRQRKELQERFDALEEAPERLSLASVQMVTDLLSAGKLRELGDDVRRPAHEARSRVGIYKKDSDVPGLVEEFQKRFGWMLEGMEKLL